MTRSNPSKNRVNRDLSWSIATLVLVTALEMLPSAGFADDMMGSNSMGSQSMGNQDSNGMKENHGTMGKSHSSKKRKSHGQQAGQQSGTMRSAPRSDSSSMGDSMKDDAEPMGTDKMGGKGMGPSGKDSGAGMEGGDM